MAKLALKPHIPIRVSEYFKLPFEQASLDFVDVDVSGDLSVFVSPRAIRGLHTSWGDECVALIQDFFATVITAIKLGSDHTALRLLRQLREPNETHLGFSKRKARGRAIGHNSASDVWNALSHSEAARTGLLSHLEDTILMVEGIGGDIVSDMTINVIRRPLIEYTNQIALQYGIPLKPAVDSGPLWNPVTHSWESTFVQLPVTQYGKLLLVPKVIVRTEPDVELEEYYRHYLLERLKQEEIAANSELVHLLKDGRPRVTKEDLIAKYGKTKGDVVRLTQKYPSVLTQFREQKSDEVWNPLSHEQLAELLHINAPNWDDLLNQVLNLPTGTNHASDYERAIEALLAALFYPALTDPKVGTRIHEGRKIIDIAFTNAAHHGFFEWLSRNYRAPNVYVECKNYISDPANKELDQLTGRFSPNRGQFGLLLCRTIQNKELMSKRCRDTALDHRGFVIALDDQNLIEIVENRKRNPASVKFEILREQFNCLIM